LNNIVPYKHIHREHCCSLFVKRSGRAP
jgi:hypothetical protein